MRAELYLYVIEDWERISKDIMKSTWLHEEGNDVYDIATCYPNAEC